MEEQTELKETIKKAGKVMDANNKPFATIWKTGNLYGFNFDKKELGYTETKDGVTRTVIAIVFSNL